MITSMISIWVQTWNAYIILGSDEEKPLHFWNIEACYKPLSKHWKLGLKLLWLYVMVKLTKPPRKRKNIGLCETKSW